MYYFNQHYNIIIITLSILQHYYYYFINIIIIIIISIDALAKANMLKNKLVDYNIKDKLVDNSNTNSNSITNSNSNSNSNSNNNSKTNNYEEKKVFKDILSFPTNFTIKIVGINHPSFVNDIVASIASAINVAPDTIKYSISNSKQNNYISITITPYFQNADEIYAAYDIISKDTRVKYVI